MSTGLYLRKLCYCVPTRLKQLDLRGDTALSWAVRRRCVPVIEALIESGADVNQPSNNGFTPYIWARIYNATEIARILTDAGANTENGKYWRRFDDDTKKKWLEYQIESVCRGGRCNDKS